MTLTGRAAIAVLAALAVSLAVNFGLAGFLVARSVPHRDPPALAERLAALGPRALPPELRSAVAGELKPDTPALRAAFRAVRDARQAVFAAMRAEPYDRSAVTAALATLRDRLDTVNTIGQTAILDALDTAPADLRAKIGLQDGGNGRRRPSDERSPTAQPPGGPPPGG
ncbi:periplasmic heavy metal sensor [Mesorhizobium sp. BR1-1-16]|uniref:periplasmic heavy metal sensor n=1 Tax=Mesorhizobium sp. BR1-1-16 TaxID=2876653 RepID=UPI001CD00A82|nr:periplasmic heavy metal sensor [Mesorhizobium sp. BR1-1-16]